MKIFVKNFHTSKVSLCLAKLSQNIAERSINMISVLNNFKSLITQVYEKGCTHKFNKKIDQNIYFRADLAQR